MKAPAAVLAAALSILAQCHMDPYFLPYDGGDQETDADASEDAADVPEAPTCIPIGPDDNCNEMDDDCDTIVDETFDKTSDPENCGICGRRCIGVNEIQECREGECAFVSCEPGFADIDPDEPGCEYRCPVYPPAGENCNGVDEDCDGSVDEPEDLLPPPAGLCRDIAGTPCEGTGMVCAARGDPPVTTWYCDYAAGVEFDPTIPNGIVMEETLCDGHDGDCDGIADDPFGDVGLECDNGLLGACRDMGRKVCDPSDPSATICDLSYPPDALVSEPVPEQCNGIDDDCDGIVDNPEGAGRVVDDMVEIDRGGLHFWIYRYEASRPDATGSSQGTSGARTCSNQGVLPWTLVSYTAAQDACAAAGKRLCHAGEFLEACGGPSHAAYPYGGTYDPAACNGLDLDGIPGGENDDILLPAGSTLIPGCVSGDGVHDLSGNAREWTDEISGDSGPPDFTPIAVTKGGSYITPEEGLTCTFDLSRAITTTRLPSLGFRCCGDAAP
jgi:hypothetical protein